MSDTASTAERASRDLQHANGGLGEYYSEHETRTPVWLCAGDTHTGTFIAALARGAREADAAREANAAAALSVTRRGPATAPTAAELASFLAARATRG